MANGTGARERGRSEGERNGRQERGRAASGWWGEQREGEQQGEQRAWVADVRWLFYFFEGNFLVVENIRCFLFLMKGVFISS